MVDTQNPTRRAYAEASPLSLGALTEKQQDAGKAISELVSTIAQTVRAAARVPADGRKSPDADRSVPFVTIRKAHWNGTVFLDGERGAGKTTLLVTLLDLYNRAQSSPKDPGLREFEAAEWRIVEANVLPIANLDLRPLPPGTAAMPFLLARFDHVIRALESDRAGGSCPEPSWLHEDARLASRRAYDRLCEAVARGWETGSSNRRARVDPEEYGRELREAEEEKLRIPALLEAMLTELTRDLRSAGRWRHAEDPLFLIAIDDVDLNVELCVEVLELTRLLSSERLSYLVAGDLRTTLAVVELSLAREQSGTVPARASSKIGAAAAHLDILPAAILEKLLPPAHRVRLRNLSVEEVAQRVVNELSTPRGEHLTSGTENSLRFEAAGRLGESSLIAEAFPRRIRQLTAVIEKFRWSGQRLPLKEKSAGLLLESLVGDGMQSAHSHGIRVGIEEIVTHGGLPAPWLKAVSYKFDYVLGILWENAGSRSPAYLALERFDLRFDLGGEQLDSHLASALALYIDVTRRERPTSNLPAPSPTWFSIIETRHAGIDEPRIPTVRVAWPSSKPSSWGEYRWAAERASTLARARTRGTATDAADLALRLHVLVSVELLLHRELWTAEDGASNACPTWAELRTALGSFVGSPESVEFQGVRTWLADAAGVLVFPEFAIPGDSYSELRTLAMFLGATADRIEAFTREWGAERISKLTNCVTWMDGKAGSVEDFVRFLETTSNSPFPLRARPGWARERLQRIVAARHPAAARGTTIQLSSFLIGDGEARLDELPAKVRAEWDRVISRWAQSPGTESYVWKHLWDATVPEALHGLVQLNRLGALVVDERLTPRVDRSARAIAHYSGESPDPRFARSHEVFDLVAEVPPEFRSALRELSEPAWALGAAIAVFQADISRYEIMTRVRPAPQSWPGLTTEYGFGRICPWPFLPVAAMWEWQSARAAWSALLRALRTLLAPRERVGSGSESVGSLTHAEFSALAFWLMGSLRWTESRSGVRADLTLTTTPDMWKEQVYRPPRPRVSPSTLRDVYELWSRWSVLFATPEAGLPPEACTAILGQFNEMHPGEDRNKLRKNFLAAQGVSEDARAQLDQLAHSHPWFKDPPRGGPAEPAGGGLDP